MPNLGPAGRGGARRRTRRRTGRRQDAASTDQPQQPAGPAAASDPMAELKKLGELHDAGVLTDDEFSAKKADILAKM